MMLLRSKLLAALAFSALLAAVAPEPASAAELTDGATVQTVQYYRHRHSYRHHRYYRRHYRHYGFDHSRAHDA